MEIITLEEFINLLSNDGYDPYATLIYTRKDKTYSIDNLGNFNWYIRTMVERKMHAFKLNKLMMFLKTNTQFFKYIPFSHVTFIKGITPVHLNMIERDCEKKDFATRTLIREYCTKTFTVIEAMDYLKENDPTLNLSIHWFNFYNEHILNVTSINLANVLFKANLEQEVNKALVSYNWE
jgi:hypothetical protein